MNEQLVVKNFGPIKDATVDFKRVTVFIGPTGGGKSTLAKLKAIFTERVLFSADAKKQYGVLNELLYNYEINNYARKGSQFRWRVEELGRYDELEANEEFVVVVKNLAPPLGTQEEYVTERLEQQIENNRKNNTQELNAHEVYYYTQLFSNEFIRASLVWHNRRFPKLLYVPADRLFVSVASRNLSNLGLQNTSFGKPILDFLEAFATSSRRVIRFPIDFLGVVFESKNLEPRITTSESSLSLYESASGIQSVAPMLSVIFDKTHWNTLSSKDEIFNFIIEEPELNLYPTAQQGLLQILVQECTQGENNLTITTHSPYILSHLNLLLYAYQVAEQHPERRAEVAAIVPEASWINPKEFACYQVENGGVQSLVNEDLGMIDNNELDALSGDAADAFDNLIRLSKGIAVK